ncbi:hypothetical protein [Streptomyces anandii]|uniref:Uncharacterized protein n=1 Tax=Streptomyces anandii TaxID=285454 RepID=A0ABW6HB81_9ACTN
MSRARHQDVQADKRVCPECLDPVPAEARRSGHCTSDLEPRSGAGDADEARVRVSGAGP